MRISRIYLPETANPLPDHLTIEGVKAHYIRNVLRLKRQHIIEFFTPDGLQYRGTIADMGKHHVTLTEIKKTAEQPPQSAIEVTLVQGISSSDRMDYTIQKAAELGCQKLIPVMTDFCAQKIPPHKHEKKQQHWQGVAISACEQSGRGDLLQVEPICELSEVISETPEAIYLEPLASCKLHALPNQPSYTVIIGPEGGFSPSELDMFEQARYQGVVLGQRVLRTETAAPVILSALHTLYGDFS